MEEKLGVSLRKTVDTSLEEGTVWVWLASSRASDKRFGKADGGGGALQVTCVLGSCTHSGPPSLENMDGSAPCMHTERSRHLTLLSQG